MALLGIIRRWHIRDQVPLREIARRLGISRNTVRRYLRSETVEPTYSERRSTRAIDKYAFQLSALLKTEAARSRKQRRTLKQIHEDLKELGFEGSYDRVAAFARTWREGQTERVNPSSKRTVPEINLVDSDFYQYFFQLSDIGHFIGAAPLLKPEGDPDAPDIEHFFCPRTVSIK
ncbi:hypothetical protein D3C81_244040 [compost metagenome]